jgi:ribosomal protein S18 acetylase RimI-like enzyme
MPHIEPAGGRWRDDALALLYRRLPARQREEQLALVLQAIESGEIPTDDLLVARLGSHVVGAVLAVRRAGGAAFLWPPAVIESPDAREVSRLLLEFLARRLDDAGTDFTQCLLGLDDAPAGASLAEGGFPYSTQMLCLARGVADCAVAVPPAPGPLSTIDYDAATHPLFVRVIERTFSGSLDCPELARRRRGESALAAHRGGGTFRPELWQIYRDGQEAAGVLLAIDHPDRRAREISYLGVVPEARGRGLGLAMLGEMVRRTADSGCQTLEVAVDAGNHFALTMYRAAGFSERMRLAVHLRLRPEPARAK